MITQITQVVEKSRELPLTPAPRSVARLLRDAANKIALKDYYGAITDADRALAGDPNNTSAYYYRAAANNLIGKYEAAAANATQAIAINPAEFATHDARAYAYFRQGRYQDAIADAHYSLELNPQNPYAYANLGFVNGRLGNMEQMLQT